MFSKTALWPRWNFGLPENDRSQVVRPAPCEDYQGNQQASASLDRKTPLIEHFFSQIVTIYSSWLMWVLPIHEARHIATEILWYCNRIVRDALWHCILLTLILRFYIEYHLTAESEIDYCILSMAFFFPKLQDSFDSSKCKILQNFGWPPAEPHL